MKRLLHCLTCIITSWCLLGFHLEVYASDCDHADASIAAQRAQCKEGDGFYWDDSTCRCQVTESSEKLREEYASCRDEKDPEKQRQCMIDFANDSSGVSDLGDGFALQLGGAFTRGLAGMVALMVIISLVSSEPYQGTCYTRYAYMVVAIGAFAFEVYTYFALDNKARDLRKRYREEVMCVDEQGKALAEGQGMGCLSSTKSGPYEAQKKAFDFLEEEQRVIAEIAKTRSIGYLVISIAYFAVLVAAIIEVAIPTSPCKLLGATDMIDPTNLEAGGSCKIAQEKPDDYSDLEYGFYAPATPSSPLMAQLTQFFSNGVLIESAYADPSSDKSGGGKFDELTACNKSGETCDNEFNYNKQSPAEMGTDWYHLLITGGIAGVGAILSFFTTIRQALLTPLGYMILSGVAGGAYLIMFFPYAEQARMAENNANDVAEVKRMFEVQAGAFCPNGREDVNNPSCYCFSEEGGRNPNRENSQTCQALFAKLDKRMTLTPDDEKFGDGEDVLGCMTRDGKFDRDCRCKLFTDKATGQSACATSPMASSSLNGIGLGTAFNSGMRDLNSITSGTELRNFNQISNPGQAKRNRIMLKKLLDKSRQDKSPLAKIPNGMAEIKAFAEKIVPAAIADAALAKLNNVDPGGSAIKDPAMEKALEQVKEAKKLQLTDGKAPAKKKEEKGPEFNFDMGGVEAKGGGDELGGFMDKKYNFKDNDIVNNEGASIWQVITNRYNQSGYLRLFEDEPEPVKK